MAWVLLLVLLWAGCDLLTVGLAELGVLRNE